MNNSSKNESDVVQKVDRCVKCGQDKAWHEPVISEDGLIIYPPDHLFVEKSSGSGRRTTPASGSYSDCNSV